MNPYQSYTPDYGHGAPTQPVFRRVSTMGFRGFSPRLHFDDRSGGQTAPRLHFDYSAVQTSHLLNEFLSKSRLLASSELKDNDLSCAICTLPFLEGDNPEVPLRLECGHVFGVGCMLKWLSPTARNSNNSCPMCRKPVFAEWNRGDFPEAEPAVVTASRFDATDLLARGTAAPPPMRHRQGPVVAGIDQAAPSEAEQLLSDWASTRRNRRGFGDGTAALSTRQGAAPVSAAPAAAAEMDLAVSSSAGQLALETIARRNRRAFENRTAALSGWQGGAPTSEAPVAAAGMDYAAPSWAGQPSLETMARRIQQASENRPAALSGRQGGAPNPTGARAGRVGPVGPAAAVYSPIEEEFDVASIFNTAEAELEHQNQEAATIERKRYLWMQFCEGVVHNIEITTDRDALANYDIALTIINMRDLDEFMAEREGASSTWQRILRTFPRLHTEMVTRFDDFRPMPSVNIDNRIELERLLAHTVFDRGSVHKARWYMRLSERLARGALASGYEAANARNGERPVGVEAGEAQRVEEYIQGRIPDNSTGATLGQLHLWGPRSANVPFEY